MVNEENLRYELETALSEISYWKEKYYDLLRVANPKPTAVPVSFGDIDPDCNACEGTGKVDKGICDSCDGTGILSYKSE